MWAQLDLCCVLFELYVLPSAQCNQLGSKSMLCYHKYYADLFKNAVNKLFKDAQRTLYLLTKYIRYICKAIEMCMSFMK